MSDFAVDVLVIGLGPGGGSAAYQAAAAGLSVLGVEKKRAVGDPVQCAEFIPLPMSAYAPEAPVRVQRIKGMKSFLPSGAVAQTDFPGLMIDRQAFDASIAEKAATAGARLLTGARLVELDHRAKRAEIEHGDERIEVNYRLLIAADGPHSPCAKFMGLEQLPTVQTRQYTVPLLVPYEDTDIWLSDDFPGGYGWLFPKGKVANVGLGADKRFEQDLKKPLDKLHAELVAKGIVGEQILYRTGGAIPVGGLREQLVKDEVVFVGDAAGLTHPITGAGISAAVVSGELAGQAAAAYLDGDEEALEDYAEEIREQFELTLARAVARRQWLMQFWRTARANDDEVMRAGWIAFDEYFAAEAQALSA